MEVNEVPPLALVVFGAAWVAGLAMFGCLFILTRRLGIVWECNGGSWTLEPGGFSRVFKLIYGGQSQLEADGVSGLVWGIRALWLAMLAGIGAFMFILSGAV